MYLWCEYMKNYYQHLDSTTHFERASRNTRTYFQIDQIWEELRMEQNLLNQLYGRPEIEKWVKLWTPDVVEIIDVIWKIEKIEHVEEQILGDTNSLSDLNYNFS